MAVARIDSLRLFKFLSPSCRPIVIPSRRHNPEDKKFIGKEIQDLLDAGVIEEACTPWRAQVLVARDGRHKPRVVIDYSHTINRFTQLDAYPLPRIEDQVAELSKCKFFSTLDLKSAYYQVPIPLEDRKYTGFEALGNLYQFTRMLLGVTNGVSAFQRIIDSVIKKHKLKRTYAYLDNITVGGVTAEEHDKNLLAFLKASQEENLTFNDQKTVKRVTEIDLLGYRLSMGSIRPDPNRMKPLVELKPPTSPQELKRTMGMFAYYARWLPKFSDRSYPLAKATSFPLSTEEIRAFNDLKEGLLRAHLVTPNDNHELRVECDASKVAIAATLSQNGRPVAFMSRTLSPTEQRYPTVEREATAIVEAVRKWAHFLHGRTFCLVTDQRSVAFMLDPLRGTKIKNNKILLWRAELGTFSYRIEHKPGDENIVPDALSRPVGVAASISENDSLKTIHAHLGHPGIRRLNHFAKKLTIFS